MSNQGRYYFRMKVGKGNKLFHFALNGHKPVEEKRLYELETLIRTGFETKLYVGYDMSNTHQLTFNKQTGNFEKKKDGISTDKINYYGDVVGEAYPTDLFWIALTGGRQDVYILVYGRHFLFCFQATGDLCALELESKIEKGNLSKNTRETLKCMTDQKWTDEELINGYNDSAFLPVKLIDKKERNKILPAVDSLSVNQYFNQGTFRPLYALGKDNKNLDKRLNDGGIIIGNLQRLDISIEDSKKGYYSAKLTNNECKENSYAAIIRMLLDNYLFKEKPSIDIKSVFSFMLSPSQLEAAAALLVMDLGYMPDHYRAGSLDYVDVRGRKRVKYFGLDSSKELRQYLEVPEKDEIELQCKNYESSNTVQNNLIWFSPSLKPGKEKRQELGLEQAIRTMEKLEKEKGYSYLLLEWWNVQISMLPIKRDAL